VPRSLPEARPLAAVPCGRVPGVSTRSPHLPIGTAGTWIPAVVAVRHPPMTSRECSRPAVVWSRTGRPPGRRSRRRWCGTRRTPRQNYRCRFKGVAGGNSSSRNDQALAAEQVDGRVCRDAAGMGQVGADLRCPGLGDIGDDLRREVLFGEVQRLLGQAAREFVDVGDLIGRSGERSPVTRGRDHFPRCPDAVGSCARCSADHWAQRESLCGPGRRCSRPTA